LVAKTPNFSRDQEQGALGARIPAFDCTPPEILVVIQLRITIDAPSASGGSREAKTAYDIYLESMLLLAELECRRSNHFARPA